jgi:hypothetical protein
MLHKYLITLPGIILLFSSHLRADEKEISERSFTNLYECMKSIHLDDKKYKGISSQQIVLASILQSITKDKTKIKNLGFDIDHIQIYKLVKSSCALELAEVEKLVSNK